MRFVGSQSYRASVRIRIGSMQQTSRDCARAARSMREDAAIFPGSLATRSSMRVSMIDTIARWDRLVLRPIRRGERRQRAIAG
jgi:hypothetical protein